MIASRLRPALVAWLLAMLVITASGLVLLPFPRRPTGWEEIVWNIGFGVGFTTMGALLLDRRPREPISRITFALGILVVTSVALRALAVALDARPGELPPVAALAALGSQGLQILAFLSAGTLLLVRFPDGRGPGRLPQVADGLLAVATVALLLELLAAGPIDIAWLSPAENPIGVPVLHPGQGGLLWLVAGLAYLVSLCASVAVIVRRYRRSAAVVRAQIRWVAAAAVLPVVLIPLILVSEWLWTTWLLSTMLLPVAIGIAILRYRLFDIDRIIGRTLAYALVTALLAAVFLGSNLVLQALLADAMGGGDTITVAVSTLLVAALFQPIRRRVQAPIDRRFNRAHQDASRVVDGFARRTRDEVDLDRLRGAVVGVVVNALRPASAGMWLRPEHTVVLPRIGPETAGR